MPQTELQISEIVQVLKRCFILLLVVSVLSGGISYWLASKKQPIYQCSAFIEIGRVNEEFLEEPHVLAEVINSQGFLRSLTNNSSEDFSDGETIRGNNGNKKRSIGQGGKLTAECLETGRKHERLVYLIRITGKSTDKSFAHHITELAANGVVDRDKKIFDQITTFYRNRESELVSRLDLLRKNDKVNLPDLAVERELFDIRDKLLPQKTYPTRLVCSITEPQVDFIPRPKVNALVAAVAGFVITALLILLYRFLYPFIICNNSNKES